MNEKELYTSYKEALLSTIDELTPPMKDLSDFIFDHPELGNREFMAHERLTALLEVDGFTVQKELCQLKTAFYATYEINGGGPKIGLLCEYDAIEGIGHACGHHMQGPSVVMTAIALKRTLKEPCTLIVIGTPAEETDSAKIVMSKEGIFDDLQVAFMMHGSDSTTVDCKSLALNLVDFNFHGKAAHAAIAPHKGISALDAVLIFFNGMEYLREHVPPEVKLHGIITNGGTAANVVPEFASTQWYIRANTRDTLDEVLQKVYAVAQGAAMQVGATVDIHEVKAYDNKFNVPSLNELLLKHAEELGVPDITEPRKVTGSTDFSCVTYRVPGACLRVKYVDRGISSHSQAWLAQGKTDMARDTIMYASKTIALTVLDILLHEDLLNSIQDEFMQAKAESRQNK